MKRRTLLATAVAAQMAVLLPGALAAQEGDTLSVLLPPWGTLPKEMTDRFQEETGITLQIQTMGWDDIRTKVVTSMVANTSPAEATEVDWSWVGQFGAAGWYQPLNDMVPQETVDDIPTAEIFRFDGDLLAIPYNNDFRILIYNKDHLEQAGFSEAPTTPDEMLEQARAIKEAGIAEYPIALPLSATEGTSTAFYLLSMAFGGDLFDAEFNPQFTDPESGAYKALEFISQALDEGLIDPAATGLKDVEIQNVFKGGGATFDVAGWAGNLAIYSDPSKSQVADQVAAALVPSAVGESRTFGLPEAVGIPTPTENTEAAATFINWMAEPENEKQIYETLGNLPPRLSVLNELNESGDLFAGDALLAQAETTEPLFKQGTPGWYPDFSSSVASSINQLAKGQVSVEEAVTAMADAAEDAKSR